jgi:hypothetical protein
MQALLEMAEGYHDVKPKGLLLDEWTELELVLNRCACEHIGLEEQERD